VKRELNILLIEDNKPEREAIIKYVDGIKDVCLAGVADNADSAIDYIKNCIPDAIILNLELRGRYDDAISFLMVLQKLNLPKRPFILVTSNSGNKLVYKHIRQCGVDFSMAKAQPDYSAETAVQFLAFIKQIIFDYPLTITESLEELSEIMHLRIGLELHLLGMNPKKAGYKYLIDANII